MVELPRACIAYTPPNCAADTTRTARRLPGVPDRSDRSGLGYTAQYVGPDVAEIFPHLRVYLLFKLD